MRRPAPLADALSVIPDDSTPTFPDPAEADERALRRDLVLLTAQRRARRRARRLRGSI